MTIKFDKIEFYINMTIKTMAFVAGISTFLMMVIAAADVILLALHIGSISIAVNIVEMLMIVTIFLALAYTDVLDRHVNADIIISKFSNKWRNATELIGSLFSLMICLLFTWQMYLYALDMTIIKKTCLSSSLPYYPFTWCAFIGFMFMDLRYIIRSLKHIRNLSINGDENAVT